MAETSKNSSGTTRGIIIGIIVVVVIAIAGGVFYYFGYDSGSQKQALVYEGTQTDSKTQPAKDTTEEDQDTDGQTSKTPNRVELFSTATEMTQYQTDLQQILASAQVNTNGIGAGNVIKAFGNMWIVAMNDGYPPMDRATIIAKSIATTNNGNKDWNGITANLWTEVTEVNPEVDISITVYEDGNYLLGQNITATNRGYHKIQTLPFTMAQGKTYHIEYRFQVDDNMMNVDETASAVGRITEFYFGETNYVPNPALLDIGE